MSDLQHGNLFNASVRFTANTGAEWCNCATILLTFVVEKRKNVVDKMEQYVCFAMFEKWRQNDAVVPTANTANL